MPAITKYLNLNNCAQISLNNIKASILYIYNGKFPKCSNRFF